MPLWLTKLALLSHCIAAAVLVGASTHCALVLRRESPSRRLARLYPSVIAVAWAAAFALGALLYPTYRVRVREQFFEQHARWAAVLFDLKENAALLLAPLVLSLWVRVRSSEDPRAASRLAWSVAIGAWLIALSGLLVVSVRSV